jgi:hypothetical protein
MNHRLVAAVVLALLAVSCHTITEDLPPPPPTGPAPVPVVVIGVPVPTPTPVPTATPATTPAPGQPTPAPTAAPPSSNSCGLPPGSGSGNNCPYQHASFQDVVEQALDNVIRNNPSIFDMHNNTCPQGCPMVLNSDAYWNAVTREVQRLGYCATNDGEELAIKNSNSFNDQYDIINSEGFVRRGAGSYRATCYPAWF